MNSERLAMVQKIYARMGTLQQEMETMQQSHPKYLKNIKELNDLRLELESIMNTVCPILKKNS